MRCVIAVSGLLLASVHAFSLELCGQADRQICLRNSLAWGLNTATPIKGGSTLTLAIPGVSVDQHLRTDGFPDVPYRLSVAGAVTDDAGGTWHPPRALRQDAKGAWAIAFELDGGISETHVVLYLNAIEVCQRVSDGPGPVDLKAAVWLNVNKTSPEVQVNFKKSNAFQRCEAFSGNIPAMDATSSLFVANPHDEEVWLDVDGQAMVLAPRERVVFPSPPFHEGFAISSSMRLPAVLFSSEGDYHAVSLSATNHGDWFVPHVARDQVNWRNQWIFVNESRLTLSWRRGGQFGGQTYSAGLHRWQPEHLADAGWIHMHASQGLNGFFEFARAQGQGGAWVNAHRIGENGSLGVERLILPHVARDTANFWTGYSLANPGDSAALVSMHAMDAFGARVASESFLIPAGENELGLVGETRFHGVPDVAWIDIVSDRNLAGLALIGAREADSFSGVLLPGEAPSEPLVFPLLTTADAWSGLALINPSGQEVNGTLDFFAAGGAWVAAHEFHLPGGAKTILLAPTGATHAIADVGGLLGLALVGETASGKMAAYLAQ